jgi:hypothetical protein
MLWMSAFLAVMVQLPKLGGVAERNALTAKTNPFSNVLLVVSVAVWAGTVGVRGKSPAVYHGRSRP